MKKVVLVSMVCCVVVIAGMCPVMSSPKLRVAVVDFEMKARGDRGIGRAVSDMITTSLVKSGRYEVYEREQLEHILSEHRLRSRDLLDPETAVIVGRLTGIQAIVYGSVTEFSQREKRTDLGLFTKKLGLPAVSTKKCTGYVTVDVRMIDTATGRIRVAETTRTSATGDNRFSIGGLSGSGGALFNSSENDGTAMSMATREAVNGVVRLIAAVPLETPSLKGYVIGVDGSSFFVDLGQRSGLETGAVFEVRMPGKTMVSPRTGKKITVAGRKLGTIVVSYVDEDYSVCSCSDRQSQQAIANAFQQCQASGEQDVALTVAMAR